MSIEEIELQRVDHGSVGRSSMRRRMEYRKIDEEIYGRRRYSELIGPSTDTDLGELVYLVDMNKRICVRWDSQDKETHRAPLIVGISTSRISLVLGECRCRELVGLQRGAV